MLGAARARFISRLAGFLHLRLRGKDAAAPQSDLRLVIERGSDNAYYVYRLIDRTTGKVVVELPRDRVGELATTPSYTAGSVVSTRA